MKIYPFALLIFIASACSTTQIERYGRYQIVNATKTNAQGLRDSVTNTWIFEMMSEAHIFNIDANKFVQYNPLSKDLKGVYLEDDTAIYTTVSNAIALHTKPYNLLPMLADSVQDLWFGDLVIFRNTLGTARASCIIPREAASRLKGVIQHQGLIIQFENPEPARIDSFNMMLGNISITDLSGKVLARHQKAAVQIKNQEIQVYLAKEATGKHEDDETFEIWNYTSSLTYHIQPNGSLIKIDSAALPSDWILNLEQELMTDEQWSSYKTNELINSVVIHENDHGLFCLNGKNVVFTDKMGSQFNLPLNKKLLNTLASPSDFRYLKYSGFTIAENYKNQLIVISASTHYGYVDSYVSLEHLLDTPEAVSAKNELNPLTWGAFVNNIEQIPVMIIMPAKGNSGVYDIQSEKWIIPAEYNKINRFGNYYLARKDTVKTLSNKELLEQALRHPDDYISVYLHEHSCGYYLFNNNGDLIKTFIDSISLPDFAKALNISITKLENSKFELANNNELFLINQEWTGYIEPIIQPEDGMISKSYNSQSGNYYTQFGNKVGLGLSDFAGFIKDVRLDTQNDALQFSYFRDTYTPPSLMLNEYNGFHTEFGKRCKQNFCLLRNSIQGELRLFEHYDDMGEIVIDTDGNINYMIDYIPGDYRTGVWDTQNKTWLIEPKYAGGIVRNNGFTMLETFETAKGETLEFKSSYHAFDKSGKLIKSFGESLNLKSAETLTFLGVEADSVIKAYNQVNKEDEAQKVLYMQNGKYGFTEAYGKGILTSGKTADWICPIEDHLLLIDNNTVKIGNLQFPVENMNLSIYQEQLQITYKSGTSKSYKFDTHNTKLWQETNLDDWPYSYTQVFISKDTILVNKPVLEIEFYGDEYGEIRNSHLSKNADDELWVKKGDSWVLLLNTGSILPTSFGYLIASPYPITSFLDLETWDPVQRGSKSAWRAVDKDLQLLKQFDAYQILECKDELSFYVLKLSQNDKELYALVGKSGKIYTTKYNYYAASENNPNVIECFNIGDWGDFEIDENGELIYESFKLED